MIVPQHEITHVKHGKCRCLLLPVLRGDCNELLPCPVEEGDVIKLQPGLFVKSTKLTVTKVEVSTLGQVDRDYIGAQLIAEARSGPLDEQPVWVISLVRGVEAAEFMASHRERYLKRKGAGLTYDPERAIRDEPAVTEAEQLKLSSAAAVKREQAERDELIALRERFGKDLERLQARDLGDETFKDLRYIQRRLDKIVRTLDEAA